MLTNYDCESCCSLALEVVTENEIVCGQTSHVVLVCILITYNK